MLTNIDLQGIKSLDGVELLAFDIGVGKGRHPEIHKGVA
jgi:hypothetical protein